MKNKIIILASDHNGFELKSYIYDYLNKEGYCCIDLGPYTGKIKVDYTDYAYQLAHIINTKKDLRGVLICGTGVGMSIVANRFWEVRAALINNLEDALKCREHNNANVLCLGAWNMSQKKVEKILTTWLTTSFGKGRHARRIEKMSEHKSNTVVFTNGIFDILHKGHIELIKWAKGLGDKLIVGLNSDLSTRKLKGKERPINSEEDRKSVIESIGVVDQVIIFDDVEPHELVKKINPDIIVKGGEFTVGEIRKRDKVPDEIEVKIFPLVKSYSSTKIIKKIKKAKHGKRENK